MSCLTKEPRPDQTYSAVAPPSPHMRIHLLSGPIHSGKTTRLAAWSAGRSDVAGILSPLRTDGRTFIDIRSGACFPMEVGITAPDAVRIGRYAFAPEAFAWAVERLLANAPRPDVRWLIIDEIGPLELLGEGFDGVLRDIIRLNRPGLNLVLVVREGLAEQVIGHYDLARLNPRVFGEEQ